MLLIVKLRKSELNAWNKCCTGFSQYFTACVASVFCFYVYVNLTFCLVWFDFSIFGYVRNPLQVFVKVTEQDTALTLGKK